MLMSLTLTLVAFIEVGGLAGIAFLVLNLENLDAVLLEIEFINYFLSLAGFQDQNILFLFSGLIILYSIFTIIISSISIRRTLVYLVSSWGQK